jgi:hypothetical protein
MKIWKIRTVCSFGRVEIAGVLGEKYVVVRILPLKVEDRIRTL